MPEKTPLTGRPSLMYTTYSSQVPQSNRVSIGIDTRNKNPANSVRYYFTDPCEIQFMFSVALIGNTASAEFAPLLSWLQDKQPSIALATSADILAWESVSGAQQEYTLTLVLQSFSDQFAPQEADRLIGATFFSGLMCCFGLWCEGDGRTRSIWPESVRVPLRDAKQVIQEEFDRLQSGHCLLPPTAARDEIFLYRHTDNSDSSTHGKGDALVISTDRVYRTTFARLLNSVGWNATSAALTLHEPREARQPHLLVHDLDPQSDAVNRSLHASLRYFPEASPFGLASMPQPLETIEGHHVPILAKLDPLRAIRQIDSITTAAAVQQRL